ncbi:MAG: mechanosensitive ion channel family protein [Spirochaetia bacterium]|jgi:small-conductance mechanosensitive channel
MFFQQIGTWLVSLSPDVLSRGLRIVLTVLIGLFLVRVLAVVTQRYIMRKSTAQRQMIARKAISYTGFVLVVVAVLGELGVKLTALLGAAGIVGIAVGFASQTSVSNIISGLFLISEKPFTVGDVIRIGTTTGIIQSIDLLSIKIRTFDNLFVRIPNEKILSSEVTNITRFPIRRMDILFQVAYQQDLSLIHDALAEIARVNPWSLDEPQPVIIFNDFKESGIEVLLGLWFSQTDFLDLKNSIMKDVTTKFAEEGIRFASPNRVIRVVEGSLTS